MLNNKITANLFRTECACHCGCQKSAIEYQLVLLFQLACDYASKYLTYKCYADVSSVFRCPEHNIAVGGEINSYHLEGAAMDFYIHDISVSQLRKFIELAMKELGFEGMFDIVEHDTYIHLELDLRRILKK